MNAKGGLSTFYAKRIDRKWFARNATLVVENVREATLDEDFSKVVNRRLRSIRMQIGNVPAFDLDPEEASWLRDALEAALADLAAIPDIEEPLADWERELLDGEATS